MAQNLRLKGGIRRVSRFVFIAECTRWITVDTFVVFPIAKRKIERIGENGVRTSALWIQLRFVTCPRNRVPFGSGAAGRPSPSFLP